MAEKNEQLKLTKLRLNVLRKRTGQNIINFFQKTDLKKEEDEEQIELILEEANAYGLRQEVEEWALKEMTENPNLPKLDAYVTAYHEWIK
jgi:hypothetical protein